jgi:hypothetical protein
MLVIKTFFSVLKVLDRSFNDAFLKRRMKMMSQLRNLEAYGYQVPVSVETGSFYIFLPDFE